MSRRREYPLEIPSFDGRKQILLAQGDDCVLVQIVTHDRLSDSAGIVLTPEDAEDLARSLRKRAQYARAAHEEARR